MFLILNEENIILDLFCGTQIVSLLVHHSLRFMSISDLDLCLCLSFPFFLRCEIPAELSGFQDLVQHDTVILLLAPSLHQDSWKSLWVGKQGWVGQVGGCSSEQEAKFRALTLGGPKM